MVQVYSAAQVHAALPWGPLAQALRQAFVAPAEVPVRHAHALGGADTLLLMPAWDRHLIITKLVTVMPVAPHTVQATVMVLDRATGEPLALLDGEALTLRRTAATSALAAQHLARGDSQSLLLVGTGRLAAWMARAHVALRPALREVLVWGRRPEAAQALAEDWPDDQSFPLLVFVTAYDQYALQAFDAQAVDYLVKPVDASRLAACVARLQRQLADAPAPAPAGGGQATGGTPPARGLDPALDQVTGFGQRAGIGVDHHP